MPKNNKERNYAFIDNQNLILSIRDLGWKLDFKRLRIFLKDKYKIEKAFLFIGYFYENKDLYANLKKAEYILLFKLTIEIHSKMKGDCDAELVMHCILEKDNFKNAIIILGDGDFQCLIEYLRDNNKLLKVRIPNKKKYLSLLRIFRNPYFRYIQDSRLKLAHKKKVK